MKVEQGFQQVPFLETHAYFTDPVLPSLLKRLLPSNVHHHVENDLVRLSAEVLPAMQSAAARLQLPKVVQYNQWGQRIDDLQTSEGWRELKAIHQKEGIPGIFYEREFGGYSRVYGFAKLLLMMGHSHMIFCPLSMTDGNARTIELLGTPAMKKYILPRLISRDPSVAYTAGQWMTERPGGSDVSLTETVAQWTGKSDKIGPLYRLDGFKWFSSATDSNVALALARTGSIKDGSRGLSLFLVPLERPFKPDALSSNRPLPMSNGIFIHRLKNKIGTHEVPTAELSLENTDGYLVGQPGQGVKGIASVLNITRLYSAAGSVGCLRRCLAIATSYSQVRTIRSGTQLLSDNELHVALLADISVVYHALVHLAFGAVHLLGKVECNEASAEERDRFRILTPVVKAFAAEKACAAMEYAMSCLGGAGYMEENEIGRLIRDGLVEKIWEGTTNVLALDLRRATQDKVALASFITWSERIVASVPPTLKETLGEALKILKVGITRIAAIYANKDTEPFLHRPSLMLFGYVASALYLLEHTTWSHLKQQPEWEKDVEILRRWVLEGGLDDALRLVETTEKSGSQRARVNQQLVFGAKPKL